jgi:hypothetical protein
VIVAAASLAPGHSSAWRQLAERFARLEETLRICLQHRRASFG